MYNSKDNQATVTKTVEFSVLIVLLTEQYLIVSIALTHHAS